MAMAYDKSRGKIYPTNFVKTDSVSYHYIDSINQAPIAIFSRILAPQAKEYTIGYSFFGYMQHGKLMFALSKYGNVTQFDGESKKIRFLDGCKPVTAEEYYLSGNPSGLLFTIEVEHRFLTNVDHKKPLSP